MNQTWLPTPQTLIEVDDPLNWRLFNLVLWIINRNSYAGKDGFVKLSDRKEICQNIQSLIPSVKPSWLQIFLSMTMCKKTGLKNIINDLHHLGLVEFLPFCLRLNRHKYAENLSYYYAQMIVLPFTNAQAHEYLKNGGFLATKSLRQQ